MESIKGTDVTVSSVQVYVASTPKISNSAVAVYRFAASSAVSVSNTTVKASPGYLHAILVTTAGGLQVKNGNTVLFDKSGLAANDIIQWDSLSLEFTSSISVSASGAVATVLCS